MNKKMTIIAIVAIFAGSVAAQQPGNGNRHKRPGYRTAPGRTAPARKHWNNTTRRTAPNRPAWNQTRRTAPNRPAWNHTRRTAPNRLAWNHTRRTAPNRYSRNHRPSYRYTAPRYAYRPGMTLRWFNGRRYYWVPNVGWRLYVVLPPQGDTTQPPQDDNYQAPPDQGDDNQAPPDNGDGNDSSEPPSGGDHRAPRGDRDNPSPPQNPDDSND